MTTDAQLMPPPPPPKPIVTHKTNRTDAKDWTKVLTPKKIQTVLTRFSPGNAPDMKPLRTPKTAPLPKSAKKDVVSFEENTHESKKENASPLATRPPWNSDVYVHQVVKTKTALTPFPHKIATGSVNPLRGRFDEDVRSRDEEGSMSPSPLKPTKSFQKRLEEDAELASHDLTDLSQSMSKLSMDFKAKNEKIRKLEKQIAQLKSQQSKTSTSNVDHVSLIESLRAETEVRKQLETEVARLKVKLEADRKQNILDAAEMKRLKNELNFALSMLTESQRQSLTSRIPESPR